VFRVVTRHHNAQHNMASGQTLEERSPVPPGLRFIRIEDCVLDPLFSNAAPLDLKFGMRVEADHWAPGISAPYPPQVRRGDRSNSATAPYYSQLQ